MYINNGQLKIVGIKVLPNCANYIKKNLEENKIYYFYKGHTWPDEVNNSSISVDENFVLEDFFNLENNGAPKISISAIVGKNGSGKSALIDIMLRLINNLAFKYRYLNHNLLSDKTGKVSGINAELYFEIGDEKFKIKEEGDINLYKYRGNTPELLDPDKKKYAEDRNTMAVLPNLFYTIVLNYSMYAFNTRDYIREWELNGNSIPTHWLNGIFHKNDGYQTPVVLNPWRTDGRININGETSLTRDRLVSLFFRKNDTENNIFLDINDINRAEFLITAVPNRWDNLSQKIKRKWSQEQIDFFITWKREIIKNWRNCGYDLRRKGSPDIGYVMAKRYLAYKTLSIAWTYGATVLNNTVPQKIINFKSKEWIDLPPEEQASEIKKLVCNLNSENSHITLKIRQTLAFLTLRHYKVDARPWGTFPEWNAEEKDSTNNARIHIAYMQIPDNYEKGKIMLSDFAKILQSEKTKQTMGKYKWQPIDLVPAHCFNTEIFLRNKDDNSVYPFSQLSSGERQQIYAISTVLYHLNNINSITGNENRIKYEHVNVIFDEIELYFHPQYQQTFIYELINAISRMQLHKVVSINIIMATHSPFILSDIPKLNILFLKGGKVDAGLNETFGANISDLLRDVFFLEKGFSGKFATNKINKIIEGITIFVRDSKKIMSSQEYEDYTYFVKLIGEPIIRNKLLSILDDVYFKHEKDKILFFKEKRLRKELEDIETEKDKYKKCGNSN